jgi:hypothetical protein
VSEGGRAQICTVRGEALGQRVNAQITLDVNTGELLIMSPDNFVGSLPHRRPDRRARADAPGLRRRANEVEAGHAQTH